MSTPEDSVHEHVAKVQRWRLAESQFTAESFLLVCGYWLTPGVPNREYVRPQVPFFECKDALDIMKVPEVLRASGECVCDICHRTYHQHPQPYKASCPTMVVTCDRRFVKL